MEIEKETDLVESLIQRAGRRIEPPEEAYRQVHAAAFAAFREKTSRRRDRVWLVSAGAAAVLVLAVTLMMRWTPPAAQQGELARAERLVGGVEVATGDVWRPLAEARVRLSAGMKIRTLEDGRGAFTLAGGESLRLNSGTEVMLDGPGRIYFQRGTIYVDSGRAAGSAARRSRDAGGHGARPRHAIRAAGRGRGAAAARARRIRLDRPRRAVASPAAPATRS